VINKSDTTRGILFPPKEVTQFPALVTQFPALITRKTL
jgi:hypothetical protein